MAIGPFKIMAASRLLSPEPKQVTIRQANPDKDFDEVSYTTVVKKKKYKPEPVKKKVTHHKKKK